VVDVSEGVARFTCPFCGAGFEVPKTFVYATCPYCGTTFRVDKPEAQVEHYLFAVNFDKNAAYRLVKDFALMQAGVAEDFESSAEFASAYQHLVPLYIFEVNVKALCKGEKVEAGEEKVEIDVHGGEEVAYVVTPATHALPIGVPQGYSFPARSRRFFKPSVLKDGVYLQPSLDPEHVFSTVKEPYLRKAVSEAQTACGSAYEVVDNSKYIGLAHYPFWLIRYKYRGGEYTAVIDASDGTVLYLEYPTSARGRAVGLAMGIMATLSAGLVGGAITTLIAKSFTPGVIGGAIASLPALVVAVQRFARSRGVYRFKPSEEAVFAPVR
jgi:transcription elongation factor Elf1